MRSLWKILLCLALLLSPLSLLADGPAKPWVVPGLELSEPQTRTRPGICKVTAKVAGVKDAKVVKIVWDVEASFEDADAELDYEPRDEGRSMQVVIPDTRGVIRVTAVAVIDGEPTKIAKTSVEVDYKPRAPRQEQKLDKQPPPKQDGPKKDDKVKDVPKGKVVVVYFALEAEGDPDVRALCTSVGLKNKLRPKGVEVYPMFADTGAFEKANLKKIIDENGGPPLALYAVKNDKGYQIRKVKKLTKDTKEEDVIEEATR